MTLRIAVTPGEPAGIGPDIITTLAQHGNEHEIVVFADADLIQRRAKQLGLPLNIRYYEPDAAPRPLQHGELCIAPSSMAVPCEVGLVNQANARYVLATLNDAVRACQGGQVHALVTGPVHKGIINEAGISFSGHTEYLADITQTKHVVMMLATKGLRVALATTHIPLADVPAAINRESLKQTLTILQQALTQDFGIANPTLLVCGLNPHAGEGGYIGREEIEVIEPVLEELRTEGMSLLGPLPADTLFTPKVLSQGNAVLAMYHDQGLPVLKYKGFGKAVNITLGLPIIRTSVDHGTALDIAGTGKADCGSLATALESAVTMAATRHR